MRIRAALPILFAAVVCVCFGAYLASLVRATPIEPPPASLTAEPAQLVPSTIDDLPAPTVPRDSGVSRTWDGVQGLRVVSLSDAPVTGQMPLELTSVPLIRWHRLGERLSGLEPEKAVRLAVWLKPRPPTNIAVEVSNGLVDARTDRIDLNTSNGSLNWVLGAFDGVGTARQADGWERLWVDLTSKDEAIVVYVYLAGATGEIGFPGEAKLSTEFGGIDVEPVPGSGRSGDADKLGAAGKAKSGID